MTKNEFIDRDREWFFNKSPEILQGKLLKHLVNRSQSRLVDYMILIRLKWPVFSECPIDVNVLRLSIDYLMSEGYMINLSDDHDDDVYSYLPKIYIRRVNLW